MLENVFPAKWADQRRFSKHQYKFQIMNLSQLQMIHKHLIVFPLQLTDCCRRASNTSIIVICVKMGGHASQWHYDDVIMTMLASQITSLTVVYSIVYSGVNQRKHQSSASLAFVWEIHRGPVNFPHKWPVTRKFFPFDDVIMNSSLND